MNILGAECVWREPDLDQHSQRHMPLETSQFCLFQFLESKMGKQIYIVIK